MAMMDIMKRHMGNISRAVNNDVSVKYDYSIDKDSIINRYMQMRNELGYPLQVDSRNRRAVVYNKKGVEKEIQNLVDKCIVKRVEELKQEYLENWDSLYAVYKESVGFTGFPTTINAFSAEIQNGYNYVCLGTILTIAIGGALEVALIVFVALSAKQCFKKTTNKEEQKA